MPSGVLLRLRYSWGRRAGKRGALDDSIHGRHCRIVADDRRGECIVLAPATAVWDPRSVFFLYGTGGTARATARTWRPLVDQGWTLVVPQSSRPSPGGGW